MNLCWQLEERSYLDFDLTDHFTSGLLLMYIIWKCHMSHDNLYVIPSPGGYRRWQVKWIFLHMKWISQYLGRPPSQMAEIWPPGIFLQYIWTCKVSASYLLYIRNFINEINRIVLIELLNFTQSN